MTKKVSNHKVQTFSGNSQRAWLSSALIITFALAMFILDLASNGWKFEFGLNLIELVIMGVVILRWRTQITLDSDTLIIKQLQTLSIPLKDIKSLSINYTTLLGYVAALNWQPEGQRRLKRASLFASYYKQESGEILLDALLACVPKEAQLELSLSAKTKLGKRA